ncbi:aspartyl/glutamyl-tRNA amidotransferase subunit C [Mycoplasmopsis caviae]|uniref:Glutamyl-tRNA amidotransferase subunit C n=1 Tax=Mycoplasmopsis caviae TaxID=55603 RepID=A0A3P8LAS9_9BACT|nr:Asp-tRNA(Asn)/Glu-tRNA(Gln) amidotransferase subunit GatC [Mycoplasmopsis caviae]UUD35226.1 aspartyl/glutamyl-tRNA amidotransferase subunit C [Mycoplasmopsis caviae]VDR41991.1 glutamyl-tRNA amidotransferase subunit C [Mycoplasmopsis caviae]
MKKVTKDELKKIVASLMLEPIDEVLDQIMAEWKALNKNLNMLKKLDTTNVKALSHINEEPLIDFLREDVEDASFSISKQSALKNAKDHDSEYIITTKVVK